MSGSRTLILVVGVGAVAGIAYWQWPRAAAPPSPTLPSDAAPPPRPVVRAPDPVPPPLAGDGATLEVRDRRGGPLAGVDVRLVRDDGAAAEAATDEQGRVRLPLGAGRWRLTLADHGVVGAAELELDRTPAAVVGIVADDAAPPAPAAPPPGNAGLVGIVTAGGARLPDVTVAPRFLGGVGPGHPVVNDRVPQPIPLPPRRYLRTDGAFRWDGIAPGSYELRVSSPGYGSRAVRVNAIAGGFGDGSLALEPAGSVSGVVSNGRGVPVTGVLVRAVVDGEAIAQATTGADGVYLLDGLPAGPVVVTVDTAKGECTGDNTTFTVTAGQRQTHRIEMVCAWQGH